MSAFITVALDAAEADVHVDCWETPQGPAAKVALGTDVQLVATSSDPAALRAMAQALLDLAEWRERILAAATPKQVAA